MSCRGCEAYARRVTQLEEELKESQEDRNFVKTLWRQVQSENVDIGVIVNTVLDRVSKQNDDKDRSVLQMLQEKDNDIASLKNEVNWLTSTLELEKEDKECLRRDWQQKQDDLNELISQLEEQIAVKNLELSDPAKQKREFLVEKLDENKTNLEKQLLTMRKDLKSCVSQISSLKKRHEEQLGDNERLQSLVTSRDIELQSHKLIISELKDNISDKKEDTAVLKQKLQVAESDAGHALKALEKCDKALRASQQELVETERVNHEREEHHHRALDQLHNTISELEDKVTAVVREEQEIRVEYDKLKSKVCDECTKLKGSMQNKDKLLEEREKYVTLTEQVREKCVQYLSRPLALQDIPDVVDIILADVTGSNEDLQRSSKLIKQLQINCQEKDIAFGKLKEVHDKRLERMASLQEYLSEVLDEVKMLDKDRWKELHCDFREVNHAPQPLRHEDSSTVWADLQHYKTLCSKIKRELHSVEEECDKLKLQRTMDIDTFNEMKAAILSDQQECERKLRVANHQSVCGCNLQLEILRDKIEELTENAEDLNSENIKLMSLLQSEQTKVSQLEKCVCDIQDGATQTSSKTTAAVGTITENLAQERQKENANFINTLTLLDKLTQNNEENIPPPPVIVTKPPSKPKKTKSVCTKTIGTQTMTMPPVKVLQKPPAAMKIRMASLNQQVAVLTKAKHKHAKEMAGEESKIQKLETQLSTALRQLSNSQSLVASLNEDVRTANEEAQSLRDQIQELQSSGLRQSELAALQERAAEIRKLNHQNNLLTSQITSNNSAMTSIQKELEEKSLTIMKLEDKLSRSDKLVRQQRTDNEHMRQDVSKSKSSKEELDNKIEDLAKRLKKVQDVADNRKNYVETLKSQLGNSKVNLEQVKGYYEECKVALEAKSRELKNIARKHDAQEKMIADLQSLANRQLDDQGKQFCAVEQNLKNKITVLSKRNLEWEKCIRQAIGKIVGKIKQEKDRRVVASSLSSHEYDRAKQLSSSLLQLSEADFHDIMSSTKVNDSSQSDSITDVWKGQLAKIMCLDDFGPVLANSLFQLFEEYAKVLSGECSSRMSNSTVTGNSLTHTSEEEGSDGDPPVKLHLTS